MKPLNPKQNELRRKAFGTYGWETHWLNKQFHITVQDMGITISPSFWDEREAKVITNNGYISLWIDGYKKRFQVRDVPQIITILEIEWGLPRITPIPFNPTYY